MNVGGIDRVLRFAVGLALVAAPFLPPAAGWLVGWGAWKYALTVWGVAMLGTALFRFCPAYALVGISTCRPGTR